MNGIPNEGATVVAAIVLALVLLAVAASVLLAYGAWKVGSRLFPTKANKPAPTPQPDDEFFGGDAS